MSRDVDLERGLNKLFMQTMPKAIEKALGRAGHSLLHDAQFEENTVPLDEGTLRATGSVHVNGKLVEGGQGSASSAPAPPADIMEALVGFNMPYAAKLHEHPEYEFGEPGSGAGYLRDKLVGNANDYMQEVSSYLQKVIAGAHVSP